MDSSLSEVPGSKELLTVLYFISVTRNLGGYILLFPFQRPLHWNKSDLFRIPPFLDVNVCEKRKSKNMGGFRINRLFGKCGYRSVCTTEWVVGKVWWKGTEGDKTVGSKGIWIPTVSISVISYPILTTRWERRKEEIRILKPI